MNTTFITTYKARTRKHTQKGALDLTTVSPVKGSAGSSPAGERIFFSNEIFLNIQNGKRK